MGSCFETAGHYKIASLMPYFWKSTYIDLEAFFGGQVEFKAVLSCFLT